MNMELAMLNPQIEEVNQNNIENIEENIEEQQTEETPETTETTTSPQIEIPKVAQTEEVTERNFVAGSNTYYGTTKIDNES